MALLCVLLFLLVFNFQNFFFLSANSCRKFERKFRETGLILSDVRIYEKWINLQTDLPLVYRHIPKGCTSHHLSRRAHTSNQLASTPSHLYNLPPPPRAHKSNLRPKSQLTHPYFVFARGPPAQHHLRTTAADAEHVRSNEYIGNEIHGGCSRSCLRSLERSIAHLRDGKRHRRRRGQKPAAPAGSI